MDPTGEECKATQDKNKIIIRKLMRSTYILFRFIKYQLYGQYIHKYFFIQDKGNLYSSKLSKNISAFCTQNKLQ